MKTTTIIMIMIMNIYIYTYIHMYNNDTVIMIMNIYIHKYIFALLYLFLGRFRCPKANMTSRIGEKMVPWSVCILYNCSNVRAR